MCLLPLYWVASARYGAEKDAGATSSGGGLFNWLSGEVCGASGVYTSWPCGR